MVATLAPCGGGEDSNRESQPFTSEDDDETFGTKKYRKGAVTLVAFVVEAEDDQDVDVGGSHGQGQALDKDNGVQGKIRKMLELGLHPDTPDIEAQQALQNAQRLLTKHNLKQADVMKRDSKEAGAAFQGGMRLVELRSKNKKQAAQGGFAQWVYSLASTVADYFDAQYFSQKRSTVRQIVFYGIKQNVDCAAYAFAATFNRITKLSADFAPTKQPIAPKSSSQSAYSRVARKSYRKGLVEGLYETVKASKERGKETEKATKSKGLLLRGKENVGRSNGDGSEEENREDSGGDDCWSRDDHGGGVYGISDVEGGSGYGGDGTVVAALVVHSRRVAEEVLKQRNVKVKVRKRKVGGRGAWDDEAFLRGKKDSKTLDLGQKALTARTRTTRR